MGERGSHDFHLKIDLFWSSFSSIHWLPVQAVRPSSGFLKKGKTRTDLSHHLVVGGKAWEVKKKVEEVEFQWKFILQICGSSNPQFQSFGCLLCFFLGSFFTGHVQDKKPWQRDHELVQSAGGKSFEPRLLTNWRNSWILWELNHCWVSLVKVKGKRKGMDSILGVYLYEIRLQQASSIKTLSYRWLRGFPDLKLIFRGGANGSRGYSCEFKVEISFWSIGISGWLNHCIKSYCCWKKSCTKRDVYGMCKTS